MSADKTPVQRVEEAKIRLANLQNRITRARTIFETEQANLTAALAEAKSSFDVDNAAELEQLCVQMEAENERMATAFEASLSDAEVKLRAVEAQMAA